MKILSRKTTEAFINNLSPGKEYEFMVLSQDNHGDGMFSKALRIFTKPSEYTGNLKFRNQFLYSFYKRFAESFGKLVRVVFLNLIEVHHDIVIHRYNRSELSVRVQEPQRSECTEFINIVC